MKKLLLIAGILVLTLSFLGCQKQSVAPEAAVSETSTATVTVEDAEETASSSATLEVVEKPEISTTATLEVAEGEGEVVVEGEETE